MKQKLRDESHKVSELEIMQKEKDEIIAEMKDEYQKLTKLNAKLVQDLQEAKQRMEDLKPERKKMETKIMNQRVNKPIRRKIMVAGDSILKSQPVKVNCFPGATTADMVSFIQPLIARDPDHIILHIGTNDLAVDSPQDIAQKIVALTKIVTDKGIGCTVSEVLGRDNYLSLVGQEVNRLLKQMLSEHIKLVTNDSIKTHHLNRTWLHLNSRGIGASAYNLRMSAT